MTPLHRRRRKDLLSDYAERRELIRKRLEEFRSVPRSEVVYELLYCLLTPQSSALNAGRAIEKIRAAGCAADPKRTAAILRKREHYVRFHNTKALRVARAWAEFPALDALLQRQLPGEEVREWLIAHVPGLGWKESSHFLRNIGFRNLAILDRHILRNLQAHGVIRRAPASLTPKRYRAIERAFRRFADRLRIPMDEIDLLFWSRETGVILK
jgi:N-glycosylase/DNA lyase